MDRDLRRGKEPDRSRVLSQVEAVWRIDAPKIVAALTRYTGDFALAEDVVQDALSEALSTWPKAGPPANPAAWLTTTAKRRAIDTWRRRERLTQREALLATKLQHKSIAAAGELPWDPETIDDDVLRLVMIACHPVLARPSQLALTLRVIGGLTTEQIAPAFLTSQSAIQQRIVRAKKTLRAAQVPFELPPDTSGTSALRESSGCCICCSPRATRPRPDRNGCARTSPWTPYGWPGSPPDSCRVNPRPTA